MKNLKEQKIRFLTTKITSLKKEFTLAKEIFNNAQAEVEKMFTDRYFPEKATERQQSREISTDKQEQSEQEFTEEPTGKPHEQDDLGNSEITPQRDPALKKMYKTIARKTHPDTCHDASKFEKERKAMLFNAAKEAYEEGDYSGLIEVCKELDMEIPELPDDALVVMEQQVLTLKKEIHTLHSTYIWSWVFASTPEEKENFLKEMFKRMHDYIRA